MFNSVFKIIYFIEFILITIVRSRHTTRYRKLNVAQDKKSWLDLVLLAVAGIGMLVPLVYVFSSRLDFANYFLPPWVGWLGVVLFALAIWLLWRSHVDLGRNWTPTLGIREDHQLVTDGVFKHVRHPMYAAHLLWAIAQVLMLHNWIAGYSLLVASIPQYLLRVTAEEEMMCEHFGEAYKDYIQRTGRILPRMF